MGQPGRCGVDLPEPPKVKDRLNGLRRAGEIGLPGLSEPQVVQHYTRLSQKNYAIDMGVYPLGSCTMKHNPRINEKVARLPGIGDLHPLQPVSTVQGALELIDGLAHWLKTLTGMPAVAMSPAAGAHGEMCGMMAIAAALEARGERAKRKVVLAPESAHGTNPATAAALGFTVKPIPANERGRVDLVALKAALGPDVAAIMLTNPNTCGLFETRDRRDLAGGARGGRLLLLRRRQLQRHRRPRAAGRSRRRLHAHQPAQDLLDAARRRRAGRGAGGAVGGAGALCALSVDREGRRQVARRRGRRCGRGQAAGTAEGLPRPDGHVHPRAQPTS